MNKTNSIKWGIRALGIIIFLILISKTNVKEIFFLVSHANAAYLIAGFLLVIVYMFLRATRWYLILKAQDIKLNLKDSFLIYSIGTFVGVLTPGKLGDFVKVAYLKTSKISFGKSFVNALFDRLIDLVLLFIIGYSSIIIFFSYFKNEFLILTIMIVVLFILLVFFLKIKKWFKKMFSFIIPKKFKRKINFNIAEFKEDLLKIQKNGIWLILLNSILSWALYFYICYLFAMSLGIKIGFIYLTMSTAFSVLITLIPISILGIGTRDMTLVYIFSQIGIAKEPAIAFSVLILLMNLFGGFIGFLCWLIKPIKLNL